MRFALRCGVWLARGTIAAAVVTAGEGCRRSSKSPEPPGAAGTASAPANGAATAPASRPTGAARVDLTLLPDPIRRNLAPETGGMRTARLAAAWSAGEVAFAGDDLVFRIARDYDQDLAVPVRSLGARPRRIVARVEPFDDGLLGDFVGDGSAAGRPLDLAAGADATLALHVYAQDAGRACYRTNALLCDADTGQVLAAAPVTVFVPLPAFSATAAVGEEEPGTLARKVTVTNGGEALTDFAVRAGPGLEGRVLFHPLVEHAYLGMGQSLSFSVRPRLATDFTGAEGSLVLSAAGQEKQQPVKFRLPAGKHVFVATSFSTTNDAGSGKYCTNNPNTNSPIGGPDAPPDDPYPLIGYDPTDPLQRHFHDGTPSDGGQGGAGGDDDDNPIGRLADYLNRHLGAQRIPGTPLDTNGRVHFGGRIGPITVSGDAGAAPGSDPRGPLVDANYTIKIGPVQGTGTATGGIHPQVSDRIDISSNSTPAGSVINQSARDDPGGSQAGPRGLRVRGDYAAFRRGIYHRNEPEAMIGVGGGPPAGRVILQTWHSDRWCPGTGRQVLLRLWDGTGARRLSRDIALTAGNTFGQWPAALALPDGRALVVWETSATWHGPPSLAYRVSTYGYGQWSAQQAIPGGDDPAGSFDPVPVVGTDNVVRVFWQRGRDAAAKVFFTHGTEVGDFAPAAEVKGLPPGAQRPLVRVAADGAIHLVCQAGGAVYYAVSHDGGASFERATRVSPPGLDSGEADLLVAGGSDLHCAFRAGPEWGSRIFHTASHDGGASWGEAAPVTAEDQFAEYPVLSSRAADGATQVQFYGGERKDRERSATTAPAAAPGMPPAARAILKSFATVFDGRAWSPPRRLLTHFPAVQAAWLEVEFHLISARSQYSPHELSVLLNGHPLIHQSGVIPEGTYLLPFDPLLLCTDGDGLSRNVIGLRTVHMSQGQYQTGANFRLQARLSYREVLVVADGQADADAIAARESDQVNHGRADVGVFARFVEPPQAPALLPDAPKQGELITLPLRVGNLGETVAGDVRLAVYATAPDPAGHFAGPPVAAPLNLANLAPLELRDLEVKFPYGGAERYFIVATHGGEDFDPGNNVYQVSFAAPRPPSIRAAEPDATEPVVAGFSDDPAQPFRWRIIDAAGREVARVQNGALNGDVPPGKYRLALQRYEFEGGEVIFPDVVEKKPNEPLRASMRTAVELVLPARAPAPFRWELVSPAQPGVPVQWLFGRHTTMLVPPGEYRVAMQPTEFDSKRLVWPEAIRVGRDAHVVVNLGSGVAPPPSLLRSPPPFQWALWPAQAPEPAPAPAPAERSPDAPVQFAKDWSPILVPPGRYRWGILPLEFQSIPAMFPAVEVKAGGLTPLPEPARFTLVPSDWSGAPYSYALVDPGTGKPVQRFRGGKVAGMWVPPGDYDLVVQPHEFGTEETILDKGLRLESGRDLRRALDTGIALAPAQGIKGPWQVEFFREGDAGERPTQRWTEGGGVAGGTPLPAGTYRVVIQPLQFGSNPIEWAGKVVVERDRLTKVGIDSGVALAAPTREGVNLAAPWQVSFYREGTARQGAVQQVQEPGWRQPTPLPPGKYRVGVRPVQFDAEEVTWPDVVEVGAGKVETLKLECGLIVKLPREARAFQVLAARDGKLVQRGKAPATALWLPPGSYRVQVRLGNDDAWKDSGRDVKVEAGRFAEAAMDSVGS